MSSSPTLFVKSAVSRIVPVLSVWICQLADDITNYKEEEHTI